MAPKQAGFEWGIAGFSGPRLGLPLQGLPTSRQDVSRTPLGSIFPHFFGFVDPTGIHFLSIFADFASQIAAPNVTSISPSKQKSLAFPLRKEGMMEGRKEGRKTSISPSKQKRLAFPLRKEGRMEGRKEGRKEGVYQKVDLAIGKGFALQTSRPVQQREGHGEGLLASRATA